MREPKYSVAKKTLKLLLSLKVIIDHKTCIIIFLTEMYQGSFIA